MNVGVGDIIPRWELSQMNNSLRYFVGARDFPSPQDSQDVAMAFQQAAK